MLQLTYFTQTIPWPCRDQAARGRKLLEESQAVQQINVDKAL